LESALQRVACKLNVLGVLSSRKDIIIIIAIGFVGTVNAFANVHGLCGKYPTNARLVRKICFAKVRRKSGPKLLP
jgi:hypothetical protein